MSKTLTKAQVKRLRAHLDPMLEGFDYLEHRAQDPVDRVWSYSAPEDQEIAALMGSVVAYGRVSLVMDAGRRILEPLGPSPSASLDAMSLDDLEAIYHDYVYRMTRGQDVIDLLMGIKRMRARSGSLAQGYAQAPGAAHIEKVSAWVKQLRQDRASEQLERGLKYLIPDPADGGASKRLHLFFRWVSRGPDAIDLGIWPQLKPSALLMPLDTHTARICAYLGLTSRKSVDSKMVQEVTAGLKQLDAQDPLKYDFAICHLGISKHCVHKRSEDHCPQCPLEPICVIGQRGA